MLSETDIVAGYMWLLGRVPSGEEIAAYRARYVPDGTDSLGDFQRELLTSAEFRNRRLGADRYRHTNRSELNRGRLVFVHIEKCGGTTLHDMLCSHVAPERICPERRDTIGDWTINELADYELFSGHFDLAWCRCIPGELRVITMLREPKSRLVSLFSFWKAHRPDPDRDLYDLIRIARDSTAEEFFAHPRVLRHPSIRDAMAGQLTRTRAAYALEPDDPIMADPERVLAQAVAALEGMTAFGLTERFEQSRLLLNQALDLRMEPVAPRQVLAAMVRDCPDLRPVPPVVITPRLDLLLDRLTGIDRRLYATACAVFERRAAAMRRAQAPASRTVPLLEPLARHLGRGRWAAGRGPALLRQMRGET